MFALPYEWEFWSKFYRLQFFFSEGFFFMFTTYLQLPMAGLKIKFSKNIFDWLAQSLSTYVA
jgi:hypothetical protein